MNHIVTRRSHPTAEVPCAVSSNASLSTKSVIPKSNRRETGLVKLTFFNKIGGYGYRIQCGKTCPVNPCLSALFSPPRSLVAQHSDTISLVSGKSIIQTSCTMLFACGLRGALVDHAPTSYNYNVNTHCVLHGNTMIFYRNRYKCDHHHHISNSSSICFCCNLETQLGKAGKRKSMFQVIRSRGVEKGLCPAVKVTFLSIVNITLRAEIFFRVLTVYIVNLAMIHSLRKYIFSTIQCLV